jgi:hypothetical protein
MDLEDHGDALSTHLSERALVQRQHVAALEDDAPLRMRALGRAVA